MERYTEEMTQDEVIHNGLQAIAKQLSNLGNGNAATQMGAVEVHGKCVSEAIQSIANQMEMRPDYSIELTELYKAVDHVADALHVIADNMN